MIVTLLKNEGLNSISLPDKVKGKYWIMDYSENGEQNPLIGIEGIYNQWMIKSNKKIEVFDNNGQVVKELQINPYELYSLYVKEKDIYVYLFTEPVTTDRKQYKKYFINTEQNIHIGRSANNHIQFDNIVVSSTHARLVKKGGLWEIHDENSTNGTYVNNKRITKGSSQVLKPSDVIFIMGLKIIIGNGFFALNNPDQNVKLNDGIFLPYIGEKMYARDEDDFEEAEPEYFYRSPRFKRDIKTKNIKVDSPPGDQRRDEMPLMLTIGPSMTMGLASLTTGLFAVNNAIQNGNISSAVPSIVMSASMLLGTVMWPIISKQYEKKRSKMREIKRQSKYLLYLSDISEEVNLEAVKQKEILIENYLTTAQCVETITKVKSSLWEREPGQNDFLKLRVGQGSIHADVKYNYQERKFVLDDDNLQNEMLKMCENPKKIEGVPIIVSLVENYISGVVGARKDTLAFAKGLILQMVTYYSYDEFKLVLLIDPAEEKEMEMLRWIPHVWDDDKKIRFVASNSLELKDVSAYLEQVIKSRMALHDDERAECIPYYMIMAFDRKLANKADMLKHIFHEKSGMNMSVITFYDEIKNLPKECTTVMELEGGSGRIFNKKDISGERITFMPDIYIRNSIDMWCMQLANLQLDIQQASYNLPQMMTFLEMYQVGKIEHLNALSRWKENDPTISLEVPVGVDTFGELFKLDLHEKYHGPHGLVAGMTGSGKSEFIMTYILSLALNYHPYEVAFNLIDYKGGGMAKAFETLPHTAGLITNLDGAAVNRSLVSIQSELKRRQAIFVEAGKKVGESNVDIYKYQKLYREGTVDEPLQHLFIISDEFAELKTQQPEFMEQLISAARIGRSLGVHLILATQKPAGVVDDQIWSNSKFKICLKVQDRADSMDMLKRPDAAELVETGRFYLQVGYNELFELGQSAWAGAPYYSADSVQVEKDNSIEVFDTTGHILKQMKPRKQNVIRNPQKQLDAVTDYLKQTAENENIQVRPLWMEPIPEYISLDALECKYAVTNEEWIMNPVIGEFDDPSRQRQGILRLPLTTDGNTAVFGAAGMGKTTFLTAMLYSLTKNHSGEELNLYILDFSSESLRAFSEAPQVGEVMISGDDEKISNLFKLLHTEIGERRQKFSFYGGDMQSFIRQSGEKMPNIVIIINNFAAFLEQYDNHEEDIIYFSREGTKYGIYFVVTAVNTNDIRYRILQNFNQTFVLQLNDVSDYASVLGNVGGVYPSKYKGRGIFKDDQIYEFQTAYISENGTNVISFVKEYCEVLKGKYGSGTSKKIPVLPEQITVDGLPDDSFSAGRVPVGISKEGLDYQYLDMAGQTVSLLLGLDMEAILPFAQGMLEVLQTINVGELIILDPKKALKPAEGITYYSKDMEEHIVEMFNLLVKRNNLYKQYGGELPSEEEFHQVIYVLQSYSEMFEQLSADGRDKLKTLLEKNEPEYKVHFVMIDESGNMGIRTVESWHKKHCARGNGVFVGSGIADQYVLKVSGTDREMRKDLPPDFGFIVKNGVHCLVKLVTAREEIGYE